MADNILFKSGLASKLNEITKIAGQLLFAIDGTSGSIYLDKDSATRIKMNLDATKLQNARKINGTEFDGSIDITTSRWGTSRNLTIGNSTKSVNGSTAVSWSLSDIGAVAKAGDTMTGILTGKTTNTSWIGATHNGAFRTSAAAAGTSVTSASAASVISMKTTNGSWGIANIGGSDSLYFVFGTDTNYNTDTNTYNLYSITTDGHFSGSAEKANKWSNARNFAISNKAGAGAAISVDGSLNNYTLTIPSTITDFASITSTTFIGALNGNASTATALTSNAGSDVLPVYFTGGKPTAISTSKTITITARDAMKWTNARNIKINNTAGTVVTTNNLDGSQNVSLNIPQAVTNFTKLESDTFVVNDKVTLQYNTTNECLEFVFS